MRSPSSPVEGEERGAGHSQENKTLSQTGSLQMAQQAKGLAAKCDHLTLRQEDHKLKASLGDMAKPKD